MSVALWITRMSLVTLLAKAAELIVPKDAKKTVTWLKKRPFEE